MTLDEERTLLSHSYRPTSYELWAKPVGFCLLVYDPFLLELSCRIIGANNKVHIYSAKTYNQANCDTFSKFIASFEAYNIKAPGANTPRDFSFLTLEQFFAAE